MIDMGGTHDDELDTWQTVGAVTARIFLRLKAIDLKTPDDEKQIDIQPTDDEFVKAHRQSPSVSRTQAIKSTKAMLAIMLHLSEGQLNVIALPI